MLLVGMAAIAGCAGVSKEQYNAKDAEATKYKQEAQQQSQRVAALESQVTSLEQHNNGLQSQTDTLQSQASTLQSKTAMLQSQTTDLQKKLDESNAATTALQDKRLLKVNEVVLFKENSTKLTPEGKRTLDSIADALARSKDMSVIASGYTDTTEGAGKDNRARRWQLSSSRALEVAKYLSGRGVDPALIAVAGFGEARPVAPNDSLANRALNRRVEIMLAPPNQEVLTIDVKPAELMQQGVGHGQGQ
jgi:chemotaxis protein MotB